MKINPDDPCDKMTIRLKLAGMAMQGLNANPATYHMSANELCDMALCDADAMIERANRDEGTTE